MITVGNTTYLSTQDVAVLLQVSAQHVKNIEKEGKGLRYKLLGNRRLYLESDVEYWLSTLETIEPAKKPRLPKRKQQQPGPEAAPKQTQLFESNGTRIRIPSMKAARNPDVTPQTFNTDVIRLSAPNGIEIRLI